MKKSLLLLSLMVFLFSATGVEAGRRSAKEGGIGFSILHGGPPSKGEGGNLFKAGTGGSIFYHSYDRVEDVGLSFGMSWLNSSNVVGSSHQEVKFFAPFSFESRFYSDKQQLFFIVGYDWWRVKFANAEGPDNQSWISMGLGWQINFSRNVAINFKLKPSWILSNSLDQKFGYFISASFQLS